MVTGLPSKQLYRQYMVCFVHRGIWAEFSAVNGVEFQGEASEFGEGIFASGKKSLPCEQISEYGQSV